mgnify:CR=1 FL=1
MEQDACCVVRGFQECFIDLTLRRLRSKLADLTEESGSCWPAVTVETGDCPGQFSCKHHQPGQITQVSFQQKRANFFGCRFFVITTAS